MSKASDLAKVTAKGGFHLLWGLVISTVISSLGTIFIARLLGSDLYGSYTVVLTIPSIIGTFRDWGINSAMVRFGAQYRAEGRESELRSLFISGIVFEIALGLVLSIISYGISDYLAIVLHRPSIGPLIQIASFVVLANGLFSAATAAFTGMDKMELNSIMLIVHSVLKTFLIISLVVLGFSTSGAITGYTLSFTIAGLVGLILVWTFYRNLPKPFSNQLQLRAYVGTMLRYGAPISLSSIVAAFQTQYYAFLLPLHYATDTPIGNYGVAMNFVVLITFFATPITTMLFPAFSKLDAEKDKEALRNAFQFSVKYAALLVVPVASIVMCLSEPAVSTIFGEAYTSTPLFLALLSISYLYTAFGNLSTGNLISSQGHTTFILYLTLQTAAIGFPTGYVLIIQFGVLGLIAATLISPLPSLFISLSWVRKRFSVTVDWSSSAKILFSSAVAATITYVLVSVLPFASWIRLAIGVASFLLIFLPTLLAVRAISKPDLDDIHIMVSGLGPVGKIVNVFLRLIERFVRD